VKATCAQRMGRSNQLPGLPEVPFCCASAAAGATLIIKLRRVIIHIYVFHRSDEKRWKMPIVVGKEGEKNGSPSWTQLELSQHKTKSARIKIKCSLPVAYVKI